MPTLAVMLTLLGCGDSLGVMRGPDATNLGMPSSLRYYAATGLLSEHVVGQGEGAGAHYGVQYSQLSLPEAADTLSVALEQLAGIDPLTLGTQQDQLAYWLNLYNLGVLDGVVRSLSAQPSFSSVANDGFMLFKMPMVRVGEHTLTLDQIEHGVLRGQETVPIAEWHTSLWGKDPVDARIHFAVNCASMGCPDLQPLPWQAATLDADLDRAGAAFVANPDKGAGPNGISELFDWFSEDFAAHAGSVEAFVSSFREDGGAGVDFDARIPYDWSLNAAR